MDLVVANRVSKRFKNKVIIDNIGMTIKKGEIVGILGSSGSGKSTFIKILIGFMEPTKGSVKILSEAGGKTKNPLGYSMQNNAIYTNLTVKQNLHYFAKIYNCPKGQIKQQVKKVIEKLKLKEYENELVLNLSGGTKKRVDIACALINNPEIVVFDEPFVGLDPELIESISKLILELNKEGKTIVISSHRIGEVSKICTRLVAIKNKKFYALPKARINEVYK